MTCLVRVCGVCLALFKAELQFSGVTGWHAGGRDAARSGNIHTFNTFWNIILGLDFLLIQRDGLELAVI